MLTRPRVPTRLAAAAAVRMLAPQDAEARKLLDAFDERNRTTPAWPGLRKDEPKQADGSGVFFPQGELKLYATHHCEPAGYPGCLPDVRNENGEPRYRPWGNPAWQPYPGSVEHYRTETLKYTPPWTLFNAVTLVKNFRATELPEAAGRVEDYAEPVWWVPRHADPRFTGRFNKPVPVVRAQAGDPAFTLDCGTLAPGVYALRAIGAVESAKLQRHRTPLVLRLTINDGLAGESSVYRFRCKYVEEFYALAEFYFHAPERRAYQATLTVEQGSQVDALIHTIDLHDALAGAERRAANPHHTGQEEYNWFLAVLFPQSHLRILPYNRCVADLNGLTPEAFLKRVGKVFDVTPTTAPAPAAPRQTHLYLAGRWYRLAWAPFDADPVAVLDVSVLQDRLLQPILGIDDPRTSTRISFVGGIRGTGELVRRVDSGREAVAFSMYPCTVQQMMDIADAGQIMPPKSTWFEPKLRSGLLVHELD